MRAFIAAIVIGLSPLCAIAATADGNTDPLAPAEILDRIRLGRGTLDDLTSRVYPEVGPELRDTARENLRAHLLKLRAEGRAREADGGWQGMV